VRIEHSNFVRDLIVVGKWEGGSVVFELLGERQGLEMAVLV
jgi:hypothetical protein